MVGHTQQPVHGPGITFHRLHHVVGGSDRSAAFIDPLTDDFKRVVFDNVGLEHDQATICVQGTILNKAIVEHIVVAVGAQRRAAIPESSGKVSRRAYAWSADDGESWSPSELEASLACPRCQASIVRFSDERRHDKNRIVFGNPAAAQRRNYTVRISYDECKTWSAGKTLHAGPAAYSDLATLPDMTIGCLYECGEKGSYEAIVFARFSLEWLTDGKDSFAAK